MAVATIQTRAMPGTLRMVNPSSIGLVSRSAMRATCLGPPGDRKRRIVSSRRHLASQILPGDSDDRRHATKRRVETGWFTEVVNTSSKCLYPPRSGLAGRRLIELCLRLSPYDVWPMCGWVAVGECAGISRRMAYIGASHRPWAV